MAKVELINPVGDPPEDENSVARPLGDFKGKKIGFRTDHYWKSFDVFTERVRQLLKQKYGVEDTEEFKNFPNTGGKAVADVAPEFVAFSNKIDAAILGLCA